MLELASPLLINFLGGFALNQNTPPHAPIPTSHASVQGVQWPCAQVSSTLDLSAIAPWARFATLRPVGGVPATRPKRSV